MSSRTKGDTAEGVQGRRITIPSDNLSLTVSPGKRVLTDSVEEVVKFRVEYSSVSVEFFVSIQKAHEIQDAIESVLNSN